MCSPKAQDASKKQTITRFLEISQTKISQNTRYAPSRGRHTGVNSKSILIGILVLSAALLVHGDKPRDIVNVHPEPQPGTVKTSWWSGVAKGGMSLCKRGLKKFMSWLPSWKTAETKEVAVNTPVTELPDEEVEKEGSESEDSQAKRFPSRLLNLHQANDTTKTTNTLVPVEGQMIVQDLNPTQIVWRPLTKYSGVPSGLLAGPMIYETNVSVAWLKKILQAFKIGGQHLEKPDMVYSLEQESYLDFHAKLRKMLVARRDHGCITIQMPEPQCQEFMKLLTKLDKNWSSDNLNTIEGQGQVLTIEDTPREADLEEHYEPARPGAQKQNPINTDWDSEIAKTEANIKELQQYYDEEFVKVVEVEVDAVEVSVEDPFEEIRNKANECGVLQSNLTEKTSQLVELERNCKDFVESDNRKRIIEDLTQSMNMRKQRYQEIEAETSAKIAAAKDHSTLERKVATAKVNIQHEVPSEMKEVFLQHEELLKLMKEGSEEPIEETSYNYNVNTDAPCSNVEVAAAVANSSAEQQAEEPYTMTKEEYLNIGFTEEEYRALTGQKPEAPVTTLSNEEEQNTNANAMQDDNESEAGQQQEASVTNDVESDESSATNSIQDVNESEAGVEDGQCGGSDGSEQNTGNMQDVNESEAGEDGDRSDGYTPPSQHTTKWSDDKRKKFYGEDYVWNAYLVYRRNVKAIPFWEYKQKMGYTF